MLKGVSADCYSRTCHTGVFKSFVQFLGYTCLLLSQTEALACKMAMISKHLKRFELKNCSAVELLKTFSFLCFLINFIRLFKSLP